MHYYQFNIGEYASHTRHLSPIEDLAYRRLLDLSYTTELPLIKDIRQLTRLINLRDYQQETEDVLKEFFLETDDGWINNRVIKEIDKTGRKSEAAKNSAAIRWDNERKAKKMQQQCEDHANAPEINANAPEIDATNNPLPITNNQEPNTQYQEPIKNMEVITITEISNVISAEKSAPAKKGKSLDKDWQLPKDWGEWALSERPELNADQIRKIAENFKDHWLANANQAKSKKADWEATWRVWVRNQKSSTVTQFKTKAERIADNNERAAYEFLNGSDEKTIEAEVIHA